MRKLNVGSAMLIMVALAGCSGAAGNAKAGGVSPQLSSPVTASSTVAPSPGSAATGASPPVAVPTPGSPPATGGSGVPSCATSQLTISVGGGSGGAAGSLITAVLLTNRSATACTVNGYPGVSYVAGADGHQVGSSAQRAGTPAVVTMAPGAQAHATLRIVSYQALDRATCQPTATTGYRIYPPNQTDAAFVRQEGTSCAATTPVATLLTVSPVQLGPPTL